MKRFIPPVLILTLLVSTSPAFARYTQGYYRSNGTYVNGYHSSDSDGSVTNNYSYAGNTNPYTGGTGSNYYRHNSNSPYYDGSDN